MNTRIHFCGQPLSDEQLKLIIHITENFGRLSRNELSHTLCELMAWQRPNGRLKTIECRALLEQMLQQELISLPAIRPGRIKGSSIVVKPGNDALPEDIVVPLSTLQPIRVQLVQTAAERDLWRQLVERHHYLGHRVPFGAHLRYLFYSHPENKVLGAMQFSSPAWRMQARDHWIGWNDVMREKHLQHIINNSRFLILPYVKVKNLASHVLSLALTSVVHDWQTAYGVRPLLAETLVDSSRYTGHCYRAANWIDVGQTTGRGRQDTRHERHGASPKRVFLYPLTPNVQRKFQQMT